MNYGFEIGGRIKTIHVKAGQFMRQGELIAELDTQEFKNRLINAEAQFKKADAELKRTSLLNATGNASNANLEQAIANQLRFKTELETETKRLQDTRLKMPYDGTIGSILAEAQQIVNPGTGVVRIQGDDNLEMTVGIPAQWLNAINTNYPAEIQLSGIEKETGFPAIVVEVSQDMSRNTTYPVILELESADNRLREGMDGEAFFEFPNPSGVALLVPFSCVASAGSAQPFIWKVNFETEQTKVSSQPVQIGMPREGGMVEVLGGVKPGDVVVTRGVTRLEEAMEIQVLKD
ncbi:MAG: efflux RND transporter periplasmic adaptor subunit [Verrucomicrobia bacterium]|nr:efflux RND transporter periplasmic adaptor subunit [Verrucomicrobiota bacterium]